jgi:hypothetical protein
MEAGQAGGAFFPARSTSVFFQKILDHLFHELKWSLPGFVDSDPQASLEGSIEIRGNL